MATQTKKTVNAKVCNTYQGLDLILQQEHRVITFRWGESLRVTSCIISSRNERSLIGLFGKGRKDYITQKRLWPFRRISPFKQVYFSLD